MIDTRTIGHLEAAGFTHIEAICGGCGYIVQMPFRMLREQKRIEDRTTVADLRRRYVCKNCRPKQATSFGPWKMGEATAGLYPSKG